MKKCIIILSTIIASLSLTGFAFINWSYPTTPHKEIGCMKAVDLNDNLLNDIIHEPDPELVYKVASRFSTITKEKLDQAKSITEVFPKRLIQFVESYQSVKVALIYENNERGEIGKLGDSDKINSSQKELLRSAAYSTNFIISANCKKRNPLTDKLEKDSIVIWMTIAPESNAQYVSGHDALLNYLKENTKEETKIISYSKLQPAMISFIVTASGDIDNIKLTDTSGYPSLDKVLVNLISNMPNKWQPATNSKGEKVDQELIFFFGKEGC